MIKFIDSFDNERAVEFRMNGRWVDVSIYVPKRKSDGVVFQMPLDAFKELRMELCDLKETNIKK